MKQLLNTIDSSLLLYEYNITHMKGDKETEYTKQGYIFEDDTIQDVFIKLSQLTNEKCHSDHIYAWYMDKGKHIPIGFRYLTIEDYELPFTATTDEHFYNKQSNVGNNIITINDFFSIIESYQLTKKIIYFTTLQDYLRFLKIPLNKELTNEVLLIKK